MSVRLYKPPGRMKLVKPYLIMGLQGSSNIEGMSTSAIQCLHENLGPEKIGEVGRDEFYIHSMTRPRGRVREGRVEDVSSPSIGIYAWKKSQIPRRDLILLSGDQPDQRWVECASDIVKLSKRLSVQRLFTIGGHYEHVPHTRDAYLYATFNNPSARTMLEKNGVNVAPDYVGPLSFSSVLMYTATAEDLDAVCLWVGVPHYWRPIEAPYFKGTYAVLKSLEKMLEIDFSLRELENNMNSVNGEVDEAMKRLPWLRQTVADVETAYDAKVREEKMDIQLREILGRGGQNSISN